jgi:hypothetical protein
MPPIRLLSLAAAIRGRAAAIRRFCGPAARLAQPLRVAPAPNFEQKKRPKGNPGLSTGRCCGPWKGDKRRGGGVLVPDLSASWGLGALRTDRVRFACLAGALLLAGCTSPEGQGGALDGLLGPAPAAQARAPEPDSGACGNADQCKGVLKTMIDSPDRGWIGKPQAPDTYANGTRLFAYRALRTRLTCSELAAAVDEMRAASKSMDGPVRGMSADQLSRTRALSVQVETELADERAGRCKTAKLPPKA